MAKQPTIDRAEAAQKYGFTVQFMDAYPEVGALIEQAVKEEWTPEKFQARFKNTNFWKNTTDAGRKAAMLWTSDPAEWQATWRRTNAHVTQLMSDMGVPIDPSIIDKVAGDTIWGGWDDERIRTALGGYLTFGGPAGMAGGKAGQIQQDLNAFAYTMGVKNSDPWIQSAVRDIASGKGNAETYKNQIRDQAIASFPGFSDQIKAGMTVQDLAQPYMQSMSQVLELAPGEVNVFDPTIRNALGWKDPMGKTAAKPLWQFQNDLRNDERWKKTQNAQDSTMGVAHSILQQFGFYS